MNPIIAASVAISGVVVGAAAKDITKTIRTERQKRAEIRKNKEVRKQAVWMAAGQIVERMDHGAYQNAQEAILDWELQVIVNTENLKD